MDDDWLHDKRTQDEARLDRLRGWLHAGFWDFSGSYESFDGFSQGVCLLGGIDPVMSQQTREQYGPSFLPGGLKQYWVDGTYPKWDRTEQLRDSVREGLSRYVALGLKGRVEVRDAILAVHKGRLSLPWFEVADGDIECAKKLPPRLRLNNPVREEIRRDASVKAGLSRALKDPKTRLLDERAKPIFDRMEEEGFDKKHLAKKSRRPIASKIGDAIYFEIDKDNHVQDLISAGQYELPSPQAFIDRVRIWLKAGKKRGEQKSE